ncbi:COP9 signalosome complex subunit 6a-like [Malus domestica]|uniref:COP9 signalosome complex subunit 6a-like n=1 Tax=Malus domestica TaxID=3750 RepID=UPI0039759AE1
MAESSSSGLTFKLHPLVIVNISDHYSRVKSQIHPPVTNTATPSAPNNGANGAVEAASSSSFSDSSSASWWYSTGTDAQESDMNIHKALMDINESPVYVLLSPLINAAQKEFGGGGEEIFPRQSPG